MGTGTISVASCVSAGRISRDQSDLFALSGEFMSHLPCDILNAAGAGNEAFNHDSDAQILVLEWSVGRVSGSGDRGEL